MRNIIREVAHRRPVIRRSKMPLKKKKRISVAEKKKSHISEVAHRREGRFSDGARCRWKTKKIAHQ